MSTRTLPLGTIAADHTEKLPVKEQAHSHTAHVEEAIELKDSGWTAWLTVVSSFLNSFVGIGQIYGFGVYQAYYQLDAFSTSSATEISFIGSTMLAVSLSFGIFFGRTCELYGHRVITITGAVIWVSALIAASFCSSVPALIATQGLLLGVGGALLFVSGTAVCAPWFEKKLSLAMGIASAGSGVGGIFWSLVIRALLSRWGFRWSLRISAVISAVLLGIAVSLIKTPKQSTLASQKGSLFPSFHMFKDVKFVLLYTASLLTVFGYSTPFFYLPGYIQERCGASPTLGSVIAAVANIGLILGRIGIGAIADTKLGIINAVVGAMALAGIVQLVFWGAAGSNFGASFTFAALFGFFGGGYIGLLPVVLAKLFDPDKLATLTGLFFTSELPGQLTGTAISGALLTRAHGEYLPLIMYSGSIMLFGSLFAIVARFVGKYTSWSSCKATLSTTIVEPRLVKRV